MVPEVLRKPGLTFSRATEHQTDSSWFFPGDGLVLVQIPLDPGQNRAGLSDPDLKAAQVVVNNMGVK